MKTYRSHKTVKAAKISAAERHYEDRGDLDAARPAGAGLALDSGEIVNVDKTWIAKHSPSVSHELEAFIGGYFVEYNDGYTSWSPAEAFEQGYREADVEANGIGWAVKQMLAGERVARVGWNGKGMWLYHVPANSYPAQTDAARGEFGDMVPYGAYVAMKTAQGNVVPWLASQTDLLATDWTLAEDNIEHHQV